MYAKSEASFVFIITIPAAFCHVLPFESIKDVVSICPGVGDEERMNSRVFTLSSLS